VQANHEQFTMTRKFRAAATERLDVDRGYYDEGLITSDRFLGAIRQYIAAVAAEALDKTTYNLSLAARSEATGTILTDHNVVVNEGPRSTDSSRAAHAKTDDQTKPARLEPANGTSTEPKPKT
jgi:hypothetical protein